MSDTEQDKKRLAELLGESYDDDDADDSDSDDDDSDIESDNEDDSKPDDEDDSSEDEEDESSDDDEEVREGGNEIGSTDSQHVQTQVAKRTDTLRGHTTQVMSQMHPSAERVDIQVTGKTTEISRKSTDGTEVTTGIVLDESDQVTRKGGSPMSDKQDVLPMVEVRPGEGGNEIGSTDSRHIRTQVATCTDTSRAQTTQVMSQIPPSDDTVEIQLNGKTTEISGKSNDGNEVSSGIVNDESGRVALTGGSLMSDKRDVLPEMVDIQPRGDVNVDAHKLPSDSVESRPRGKINETSAASTGLDVDTEVEQADSHEQKIFEHFQGTVDDSILQVNLLYIPLFLHWDDTTVVAQPSVNHRALSISNIQSKDFRRKMQHQGGDFAEEMHAVVYQVKAKGSERNLSSVPVYSTYVTNQDETTEHELKDVEAIYPTVEGLKECIKACGLQYKISNNSASTIRQVFERIINKKKFRNCYRGINWSLLLTTQLDLIIASRCKSNGNPSREK